jgi:hypothetical protein
VPRAVDLLAEERRRPLLRLPQRVLVAHGHEEREVPGPLLALARERVLLLSDDGLLVEVHARHLEQEAARARA